MWDNGWQTLFHIHPPQSSWNVHKWHNTAVTSILEKSPNAFHTTVLRVELHKRVTTAMQITFPPTAFMRGCTTGSYIHKNRILLELQLMQILRDTEMGSCPQGITRGGCRAQCFDRVAHRFANDDRHFDCSSGIAKL